MTDLLKAEAIKIRGTVKWNATILLRTNKAVFSTSKENVLHSISINPYKPVAKITVIEHHGTDEHSIFINLKVNQKYYALPLTLFKQKKHNHVLLTFG